MSDLARFASNQADYLKLMLGLGSDAELAQVNLTKLAEEAGEVASAFLAMKGHQRPEKLIGSFEDRRAHLGAEIGDVIATAAILCFAVGLDIDAVLDQHISELDQIRDAWLAANAAATVTK